MRCGTKSRSLVLPGATSYRDVSEGSTFCPIPSTSLAEIARLCEAIVVVVAELGVN